MLSIAAQVVLSLLGSLAVERAAEAHPGGIAVASPTEPSGVVVVDESFTFSWTDSDMLSETSTPTIDWFYTDTIPPTVTLGTRPPELEGTPIAAGIPEPDPTNQLTWDTSNVPAGAYWIWSIVNEDEPGTTQIISFSPGVVVVAHPDDDVRPAVVITDPGSSLFAVADAIYTIRYRALDPDGTGRITLEAYESGSSEVLTLATDLPAEDGSFDWLTRDLENGPWVIRARIEDGRGYSFTAYARYFLTISHPRIDPPPPDDEGCSCVTTPGEPSSAGVLIFSLLAFSARSRCTGRACRSPR